MGELEPVKLNFKEVYDGGLSFPELWEELENGGAANEIFRFALRIQGIKGNKEYEDSCREELADYFEDFMNYKNRPCSRPVIMDAIRHQEREVQRELEVHGNEA